jgi:O-antigen ligase
MFVLQALISALFSESNFTQDFYGSYGRYFGLFTWIMLFAIMVCMSLFEDFTYLLRVFLIVGCISLIYSIIQYAGRDPAPWNNEFNSILGFLGNPNFQSSFLGLFLVALFGTILMKLRSRVHVLFLSLAAVASALLILSSNSIQGIFVGAVGIASFGMYYLFAKKLYKTFWLLFTSGLATFALFILSVIAFGPLTLFPSKGTLAIRGDYWRAAFSMAKDHLLTGVGPDQFGTWYRFYRHQEALTRINAEVVTDSAHNGYLDFAANLGVIALIAYLALLVYATMQIGRFIKRQDSIDLTHATIVALFLGFQAQFLISPNQIGLVIWGWAFLGAIFGYASVPDKKMGQIANLKKSFKRFPKSELNFSVMASVLIGTVLGLIFTGPVVYSSMQFRDALVKADAIKVISAVNIWPRKEELVIYSVGLLVSNNLEEQGSKLVDSGLREFPNSFDLWRQKLSFKYLTESEKKEIQAQLHRLDPLNPEWAPKN